MQSLNHLNAICRYLLILHKGKWRDNKMLKNYSKRKHPQNQNIKENFGKADNTVMIFNIFCKLY